jgi:ribosome-binding factor A
MGREYSRTLRVGEHIQRELAQLIQQEIKDPRVVGMVTVADVEVSTDLAHAQVYVMVLGNETSDDDHRQAEAAVAALNHAAGFLRHELARRLTLRTTPALRFILDRTTEKANRLSALLEGSAVSDKRSAE